MKKMDYGFLDAAREMPPLRHKMPDEDFDIMESEVAKYLVNLPEIRQKIFNMAVNHRVIRYDSDSKAWKGVDWDQ